MILTGKVSHSTFEIITDVCSRATAAFSWPVLWFSPIRFSNSGEQHEGAELMEETGVRRR